MASSAAGKKISRKKLVARVGELDHGKSKKFILRCGRDHVEAMLINFEGEYFAYVNRCRHVGISLDWIDNQFFTEDSRFLLCANHGATYEPTTGECVWGPCAGASLQGVPLEIKAGKIFASCPDSNEIAGF
ncbi:MAG TPA: Rieske 2Fe-2S domain-containing protein [Candidatus Acidoferrales bacterium]|nr:Rieske 2Fe-2S domain-containing protein [Candidatus Acidoferrales bacterium]